MRGGHIRGALVGVESITPEGLKDVYKGFNLAGDELIARLREFRRHDIPDLGSFIFGLPSDGTDTFDATVKLAEEADLTFAQFVLLTPFPRRPKLSTPHPTLSLEEIRSRTQGAWDQFYGWSNVWARSHVVKSIKARVAFVLISRLYRQMYANTGIATDSARVARSNRWARHLGIVVRGMFTTQPMPDLQMPERPA